MKKALLFPIFMLALSALTIYNFYLDQCNLLAVFNAGLGLLAFILMLFQLDVYKGLTRIWIFLQLVTVAKLFPDTADSSISSKVIADFTQYFAFYINSFIKQYFEVLLQWKWGPDTYLFLVNPLPIAYWIVFEALKRSSLIGKRLDIKLYRDNEILEDRLPQASKVVDVIDFPESKQWFLLKLSRTIELGKNRYQYGLVKSKDGGKLKPNKARQMAYFRLAQPNRALKERRANIDAFPFIDWVFVE